MVELHQSSIRSGSLDPAGLLGLVPQREPFRFIDERDFLVLFTEANVEFTGIVGPGDQVTVRAEKIYFRKLKLKVAAEMTLADGTVVCAGELAGVGSKP
jgi:3-hydroxyacyl-[acyl-carrier-protein] dehydratase